jgi:predicted nucleotidyltransferase
MSTVPPSPTLSAAEKNALTTFMTRVRAMLGPDLKSARLFGSRARGEGHEYSDLDIALVVGAGVRARRYEIYDLAYDIGLDHHVTLAPLVIDEQRFDTLKARERLIVREIERDGIPV